MAKASSLGGKLETDVEIASSLGGKLEKDVEIASSLDGKLGKDVEIASSLGGKLETDVEIASSLVGKLETDLEIASSLVGKPEKDVEVASSLVGKLEADVEIKASAGKFHHMIVGRPHHVSKVIPDKLHSVDLHEGDWGKVGSIVVWNYVHDGEARVAKDRIEAVDPEKNLITFRVLEGDLMKEYKSFVITLQASPKEGGPGSVVHWHLEYEKINNEIAHPETLLQLCVEASKEIDEYLLSEE